MKATSKCISERALGADQAIVLVLLDVTLGDEMAGLALARRIRQHHPAVKVLLTAAVDFDSGDIAILAKPFRLLDLFVRIEATLKA
jgi:DNA-binding response OmpR family regulator